MKTHSWPHPVLTSLQLSGGAYERDYKESADFSFGLKDTTRNGCFDAEIKLTSKPLREHVVRGDVGVVLYLEAAESPHREIRRLDVVKFATESIVRMPIELDQTKFSGGLKMCVYLIASREFALSTLDCVPGYDAAAPVEKGALLGYTNAHMLFDDKSDIGKIFKVRKDDRLEYISVNSDEGMIVVSLPPEIFDKYVLYRRKTANVTTCAFLFPALVETISLMVEGRAEQEQWPDDYSGARMIVAQALAKSGLSPREVAQKGAVYAASQLSSAFRENHSKLFSELNTTYEG